MGVRFRPVHVSMTSMATALVKLGVVQRKYVLRATKWGKVKKLNPESKDVNLMLKVISCKDVDDRGKKAVDVVAGDDSGIVTLRVEAGFASGKTIAVRNCFVRMIDAHIRVMPGKWGNIKEEESETAIVPKT